MKGYCITLHYSDTVHSITVICFSMNYIFSQSVGRVCIVQCIVFYITSMCITLHWSSVCCSNTLRGVGWLGGDQGQGERRCEWCTAPLVQEEADGTVSGALVQEEAVHWWYTGTRVVQTAALVQDGTGGYSELQWYMPVLL